MPIDEDAAGNEVDRILSLPGDSLACTVGFVKLESLRAKAQQSLGARFDPRSFHDEVLKNGALPMDLLESNLKVWVETEAKMDQP